MAADNSRTLPPGTIVGNTCRIEKVLGSGGFGITYLARDTQTGTYVALKEYMPLDIAYRAADTKEVRPTGQKNERVYERFRGKFLDEARMMYQFRDHPNVVGVQRLFTEFNTAYYIMEYVEGEDLSKYLSAHGAKLPWSQLQPIFAQVVSALERIHKNKVIHCDISPDNIFLQKNGHVKLLDFGASKNTLRSDVAESFILKKPGYTPPEQAISNMRMGPWTDIYALAATIYRAVTGQVPPSYDVRLINDRIQWPSQRGIPQPHPGWENALQKGMMLRREDRYSDVLDFWRDLSGGAGLPQGQTIQPNPGPAPIPVPQPQPRPRPTVRLVCRQGVFAGRQSMIGQDVCAGVDPAQCQLVFPIGTPGISRRHLCLWVDGGTLMVMDLGSTYGTMINNTRLTPHVAYPLSRGSVLVLPGGQLFVPE